MKNLDEAIQGYINYLESQLVHDLVHRPVTIKNEVTTKPSVNNKSDVSIFGDILTEMYDLYKRKNKDYGNSFSITYGKYGDVMSAVRLGDKFNRFEQLIKGDKQEVNDESIDDTLIDLANYAVMTLVERRKIKESK